MPNNLAKLNKTNTFIKKEKESSKLRMGGGAWSINLDKLPKDAQGVLYITEAYKYLIDMKTAHAKGFVRILGGETKLVVPEKAWTKR